MMIGNQIRRVMSQLIPTINNATTVAVSQVVQSSIFVVVMKMSAISCNHAIVVPKLIKFP